MTASCGTICDEQDDDNWFLFGNTNSNSLISYLENDPDDEANANSVINGLHWEFDGLINEEPSEKQPPKQTTIKSGCEHLFKTPIDSTLAIFPVHFWEIIKVEVNRYAEQKLCNKQGKKLIAGYKWKPVTLSNIMTYFSILMYGMLYHPTGRRLRDSWDSPYQNAWTKFLSKGRYLQITSVLHFNDNGEASKMTRDSLHKIRPLLNIVKRTLGHYANLGSEHSFDEAAIACKASYGMHLIVYNGAKPTEKFHCKMYMMCWANTNLTHKIKIHTRDNSDKDNVIEEECNEEVTKIDALTLEMCKPLFGTGCVVNMDNYYMRTTCAMKLRANGVLCRGAIRSSRKFVLKSMLFTTTEVRQLPRGTQCCVVNEEHQMLAIGWIDNKAIVHGRSRST